MTAHQYTLAVTSVHDGDTLTGVLDLGCNVRRSDSQVRMLGINAPELVTTTGGHRTPNPPGEAATLALLDMLGRARFTPTRTRSVGGIPGDYLAGTDVRLEVRTDTSEWEKYGRLLAVLVPVARVTPWMSDADFWAASINRAMLDGGHAAPMTA